MIIFTFFTTTRNKNLSNKKLILLIKLVNTAGAAYIFFPGSFKPGRF